MLLTDASGVTRRARLAAVDGVVDQTLIRLALDRLDGATHEVIGPMRTARTDVARSDGPMPGRDAIAVWADAAVQGWSVTGDTGRPVRIMDGIGWRAPGQLTALARHDETVVAFHVPPGVVRWKLIYRPSRGDRWARRRFRAATGGLLAQVGAWWSQQTVIELVSYSGDNTTVTGAEVIASKWRSKTAVVEHDQRQSVVVAKVAYLLKKPPTPRRDPSFQRRLGQWLDRVGAQADEYPEVADVPSGSMDDAVVFVHGTLSCGLAHLSELAVNLPALPGRRILRYEHDTFLPIRTNRDELVELIAAKSAGPHARIILVGHSRGGLVARAVAMELAKRPDGPQVGVATFGTPHRGTPLVRAGERLLSGLAAAASAGVSQVGLPALATAPIRYLFGRVKKLPTGIADMAEDAEFLAGLGDGTPPAAMVTFGADYLYGPEPASRGVRVFHKFGKQFFYENGAWQPNDLLVSLDSAIAVGDGYLVDEACGHFDYLVQPELAEAVAYLMATLAPAP